MKVKVDFVFEMDVPDTASFEQKNNLIGNVLDKVSEDNQFNAVEFSWRKSWDNRKELI